MSIPEREITQAKAAIQRFRTRFETLIAAKGDPSTFAVEGHYIFALQASFPLYFTPDLLYRLWQNFNTYRWQNGIGLIDPLAVSDFLLSSLCREIGQEQFELNPAVRRLLLQDLLQFRDPIGQIVLGEKRRAEIAEFLEAYATKHYNHPADQNLLTTHVWTAQAVLDPTGSARNIVNALSDSLQKNDTGEVLRLVLLADSFQSEAFREIKSLGGAIRDELFLRPVEKKVVLRYVTDDSGNASILLPPSFAARVESAVIEPPAEKEYGTESERRIAEALEKQLLILDLSGLGLGEIPNGVFQLTQLTHLDLSHNHLTDLPDGLLALTKLQHLNVRNNPLSPPWSEWMQDDDCAQIYFAWKKNPAVFKAVCRVVLREGEVYTGFLIKDGYLVTCNHVLSTPSDAANARIEFNYEKDATGSIKPIVSYHLDPSDFLTNSNVDLNFTRVKVVENPAQPLKQWGYLEFGSIKPQDHDPLAVVLHPSGEIKQFHYQTNSVNSIFNNNLFYDIKSIDYIATSGGAPVLNQSWQVVGVHIGGKKLEDGGFVINTSGERYGTRKAILSTAVLKWLDEQKESVPSQSSPPAKRYEVIYVNNPSVWSIRVGDTSGLPRLMFKPYVVKLYLDQSEGEAIGIAKINRLGIKGSALTSINTKLDTNQTYWAELDDSQITPFQVYCPNMEAVGGLIGLLEEQPESPIMLMPISDGCLVSLLVESGNFVLYTGQQKFITGVKGSSTDSAKYILTVLNNLYNWYRVAELQNSETKLPKSSVSIELALDVNGSWVGAHSGFSRIQLGQDQFKFQVSISNFSDQVLYVGLLYLNPMFGVDKLLEISESKPGAKTSIVYEPSADFYSKDEVDNSEVKLLVCSEYFDLMSMVQTGIIPNIIERPENISASTNIGETLVADFFTKTIQINGNNKSVTVIKDFDSQKSKRKPLYLHIAYSPEDAASFYKLIELFTPFVEDGTIEIWSTKPPETGKPNAEDIQNSIEQADLILWLVSVNFLNSSVFELEYPVASERWKAGLSSIVPILLETVYFNGIPELDQNQSIPTGTIRFISQWAKSEDAWMQVEQDLRKLIEFKRSTVQNDAADKDKISTFIISTGKDASYRDTLVRHLNNTGKYNLWHSGMILAGKDWNVEILTQFSKAELIFILLSPELFNSDYIKQVEMAKALERSAAGSRLIPIIIRPCLWYYYSDLTRIPIYPDDLRAISLSENQEEAWKKVLQEIDSPTPPHPGIERSELRIEINSKPVKKQLAAILNAGEDKSYRDELLVWLQPFGHLTIWHDGLILPGQIFMEEIRHQLKNAEVIFILLSPDFLISEYTQFLESAEILKRAGNGSIKLFPVVIRPCLWYNTSELTMVPVYPDNLRAISLWKNRDEAWYTLARELFAPNPPRLSIERTEFQNQIEINSIKEQHAVILFDPFNGSFRNELMLHLRSYRKLTVSDFYQVLGGPWAPEIRSNLLHADIVFLLISSYAWNSEFMLWDAVFEIQNRNEGKARFFPILVQPCFWYVHPMFKNIPAYPNNLKPISLWQNRDEAWEKVIRNILGSEKVASPLVRLPFQLESVKSCRVVVWEGLDIGRPQAIVRHLAPLDQAGIIRTWTSLMAIGGSNIAGELINHLADADIAIIPLNQDFLSAYPEDFEVKIIETIQEYKDAGQLVVMPILVEPCAWQEHPISKFKLLMDTEKPISAWEDTELAWSIIANNIYELVLLLQQKMVKQV